jgi:dolichol-phosphate mannosyltransferase
MDPVPAPEAPPELLVVMPVYNEQASVRKVVLEWFQEVENWTQDFRFLVINDGSKDGTLKVLKQLRQQLGLRLEILDRENRGHGQSCLQGYRIARERGIPYVFQVDSDGQCDPQYFFRFWRQRASFDVIYGNRTRRDDGWRRVFASFVVRAFLLVLFRVNCVDANVPYRLMRPEKLDDALRLIPPDFLLANIALALLLKKDKRIRHGYVPIRFRERYGGEPSVRMTKFGAKATELYRQLKGMLAAARKDAANP